MHSIIRIMQGTCWTFNPLHSEKNTARHIKMCDSFNNNNNNKTVRVYCSKVY